MDQKYADYAVEKAVELLGIDSPTGFTEKAAEWVLDAFRSLGYEAVRTVKGGVLIDLGGGTQRRARCCFRHTPTRSGQWSRRSRATAACASRRLAECVR